MSRTKDKIDIRSFKGLTPDSRRVKKGFLFAALPGSKSDGRHFIGDAVRNGATAILAPTGTMLPPEANAAQIVLIEDNNPRHRLSMLAAEFYGGQPEYIVAVTGTNGKTSVVNFVEQLWKLLGEKSASIGTLGVRAPRMIRAGSMTTPDPVTLHAELADLAAVGVTHLAMEASSHGLHQNRLDGVRIKAAAFTNLSRDHLDYHADMQDYLSAKLRVFDAIMQKGVAVLNADIPEFPVLEKACLGAGHTILSYGKNSKDLKLVSVEALPDGQKIICDIEGKRFEIMLPLVGAFQAMNVLCALGLVLAERTHSAEAIIENIQKLAGVPGRLQLVPGHTGGAAIYIDYAHTPDALENVLTALRPHTKGRLVCLFGCGGDRDKGKRPIMGKIAEDLADTIIVTDDNPRSEDAAIIRQEILAACPSARDISGRREAIAQAIAGLKQGDVLVIAGKGHERGQIFADHTEPFDDFEEAQKAIKEIKAA